MYWLTGPAPEWATSTGLLVVRLVIGAAFVLHGLPKMQNPTGWMGAENAPPGLLQATAAVIEVGGGGLLILGLLTRVAALALVAQMVAALVLVHIPHGDPFVGAPGQPGAELACAYLAVSLLTAATGAGAWSLDAVLFGRRGELAAAAGPPVAAGGLGLTSP